MATFAWASTLEADRCESAALAMHEDGAPEEVIVAVLESREVALRQVCVCAVPAPPSPFRLSLSPCLPRLSLSRNSYLEEQVVAFLLSLSTSLHFPSVHPYPLPRRSPAYQLFFKLTHVAQPLLTPILPDDTDCRRVATSSERVATKSGWIF